MGETVTHFPNHKYSEEQLLRDSIDQDPSTTQDNNSTDQPPAQTSQTSSGPAQPAPAREQIPQLQSWQIDDRRRRSRSGEPLD
ncbi:MAG: hypothetical protein HYT15_00725 [Candidatus Magasanikbacteria bacterium]|nr:hypothetical protein [Candidatus Magasanikbacteria bacterium]